MATLPVTPSQSIPKPSQLTSLRALQAILREQSVLAGMLTFHREVGDVFRVSLPGFSPIVLAGADACHYVLVKAKEHLAWRAEGEPITNLLEHGVLVEDGDSHDTLRRQLNPALHKQMLGTYTHAMVQRTDQITAQWSASQPVDMLDEMRKIALLILMDTLFKVDYTPELTRLWEAVLRLIQYVSPGLWLLWRGIPHPGYRHARAQVDDYWFQIIRERRAAGAHGDDMLSLLIQSEMPEALIRDQLMTMLVAGHDTTTAMLAWAFYALGQHPYAMTQAQAEIDSVIGVNLPNAENTHPNQMPYLNAIIQETMRLYPPLPFGSRLATADLNFNGYPIPKGSRLLYSIFLTQRHPNLWEHPDDFIPERFMPHYKHEHPHPHYAYLPFGGGARICLGVAYAQVETRVVLARVLQQFNVAKRGGKAHMHMGVTTEPRPGVPMQPSRR